MDIWSCGVVLAEMLHGSSIFQVIPSGFDDSQAPNADKLMDLILRFFGRPSEEVEMRVFAENRTWK